MGEGKGERSQPQAVEAEASVLGAMLLDKEAIGRAVELIDPGCFYQDSHAVIFSTIASLYDKGIPADLVTVTEELRKGKQLDKAGGASYLSMLLDNADSGAGRYSKHTGFRHPHSTLDPGQVDLNVVLPSSS